MEHARQWLGEGDKVRAAIAFRGREMTHRELGAKILARLTLDLADLAEVEVYPKMEGYQMFTIFLPKKSKSAERKLSEPSAEVKVEKAEPAAKKPVKKANFTFFTLLCLEEAHCNVLWRLKQAEGLLAVVPLCQKKQHYSLISAWVNPASRRKKSRQAFHLLPV